MRKLATMTAASLGLLSLAGGTALACDWDDGYRQSRVHGYTYAPRTYGYYAPAYGYRVAYWDDDYDDDYAYGYGGVAVGVDAGRTRFHRRHHARTAAYVSERSAHVRSAPGRHSGASAMSGRSTGEGRRSGASMNGGVEKDGNGGSRR